LAGINDIGEAAIDIADTGAGYSRRNSLLPWFGQALAARASCQAQSVSF
jgi:hypothetical protein